MTTIFLTDNFCGCYLCRGSQRIENEIEKIANTLVAKNNFSSILVGGRNPRLVTFDQEKFLVGRESASGRITIEDGERELRPDQVGQEIFKSSDSVHGCWKCIENQEFLLFLRPEFWDLEFEIIRTRPELMPHGYGFRNDDDPEQGEFILNYNLDK